MNWMIRLTYFDGKEMNVIVPEEEVSKFLEAYKDKKEYRAPNGKGGFMTDPDKVRAITFGEMAENINTEETKEKNEENSNEPQVKE